MRQNSKRDSEKLVYIGFWGMLVTCFIGLMFYKGSNTQKNEINQPQNSFMYNDTTNYVCPMGTTTVESKIDSILQLTKEINEKIN